MLQGAAFCPQKCHNGCAPTSFIWCQLNSAAMLIQKRTKGRVNKIAQKCQCRSALPTSLIWCQLGIAAMPSEGRTKGAIMTTQQCQNPNAPASFIWCRDIIAAMLIPKRTKGRVIWAAQKCHSVGTLPNQFNGVIVKTQKCLDIVAPREGSMIPRRNAIVWTPFPTSLTGTLT